MAPFEKPLGACTYFDMLSLIKEQGTVLKASKRIEQWAHRFAVCLHVLRSFELFSRLCVAAHRMQSGGQSGPIYHAQEGIATLVGKLDALQRVRQRFAQIAVGEKKLTKATGNGMESGRSRGTTGRDTGPAG